MNPRIIRFVDLWLGRPLCAILTLHRRIVEAVGLEREAPKPRRIAFIKLIEQGSTVLAHAAVQRAIELVGRSNVYWCVFSENREIVDALELVPPENVIAMRGERLLYLMIDALRGLVRMRRLEIDTTVDLEFFARASALLAYLSGARRRVGLHRFDSEAPYRGDLMTHRVQYNPYLHTAAAFDVMVRAAIADPAELPMLKQELAEPVGAPPRLKLRDGEGDAVAALLRAEGMEDIDGPLIVFNPNAHDRLPLRKWPIERFAEIGRRIIAETPAATIAITGTAAERDAAEDLRKRIDPTRVINLAGRTTLRQAIVLYGMAQVLLTNDSGPAHFASLTNATVVVLFGPETPTLYGPLGPNAHALWAGIACSPCVNVFNHRFSPCTNNVCMQALSVDLVYAELRRHIGMEPRTADRRNATAAP